MYERRTAEIDGDFVVFLIGFHVNRWRAVRAWVPLVRVMPSMIRELKSRPELGLLQAYGGWMFGGVGYIQYWRSYEHLMAYARSAKHEHLPAWRAFNRLARTTDAVGIYHETYRVAAGQWEAIYGAMPDIGLLGATRGHPLEHSSTAATRIGDREQDEAPVPAPTDSAG